MSEKPCKPPLRTVTLAVAAIGQPPFPRGLYASEVAERLRAWGFDVTSQQAGAWLAQLSREDSATVTRKRSPWGDWEYTLTPYGEAEVTNLNRGLRCGVWL